MVQKVSENEEKRGSGEGWIRKKKKRRLRN